MENRIKMIITDLDKSLLNNERQISEYTRTVFRKCIENEIIVVFATARPVRGTNIFFDSILPHATICHNGAVVHVNKKQIYQCGINPIIAKDLLKNVIENYPKVHLAVESDDELFTNFDPIIYLNWKDIVYEKLDIEKI